MVRRSQRQPETRAQGRDRRDRDQGGGTGRTGRTGGTGRTGRTGRSRDGIYDDDRNPYSAPGRRGRDEGTGRAGRGSRRQQRPRHVPDLLVPSILVLLFCCQVGGIIALIYAVMANGDKGRRDYRLAAKHANTAKTWLIISVIIGVVLNGLAFALVFSGNMS